MQRNETIRAELQKFCTDSKYKFKAKLTMISFNKRFPEQKTILLTDVYILKDEEWVEITDHVWVLYSKRWKPFEIGKKVVFDGKVKEYFKEGKKSYFKDYTIGSIRNIKIFDQDDDS